MASPSSGKLSDFFSDRHRPSPAQYSTSTTFSSSRSSSSSTSSSFGSLSFLPYPESPPIDHSIFSLTNSGGVPFSWEQQPGIPKKPNNKALHQHHHSSSLVLLPLPPASGLSLSRRFSFETFFSIWRKSTCRSNSDIIERDPFVKALMKCTSKEHEAADHCIEQDHPNEDYWRNSEKRVSKALSDRFKLFDINAGCKSTTSCSVAHSKILIPKSGRTTSYDGLSSR